MKKGFWTSLIAAFALCFALVACGGGSATPAIDRSGFIGVWELSGAESDGEASSAEDIEAMKSFGMNVFIVLEEDGTAKINMFGEDITGTWNAESATEATLTFVPVENGEEADEQADAPITLDGDQLIMAQDSEKLTFAKSTQEAMDEFLANAPSLEDSLGGLLGGLLGDEEEEAEKEADEIEGGLTSSSASETVELDATVVDDDLLTLTLTGAYVDSDGDLNITFTATNHSDQTVQLYDSGDDWTINGQKCDPTVWTSLEPGETLDDYLFVTGISNADAENLEISGGFELDNSDYDTLRTWSFTL